jgi:hypothetical protein
MTNALGMPQAFMRRINLLQIHCVFDCDRAAKPCVRDYPVMAR